MLRTLATSFFLAFSTSLVLGVALPEPAAYAQSKKPPPPSPKKGGGKKKKGPDGKGPFDKDKYPLAERIRPLVLPNGMGEVGLDLQYFRIGGGDAVGTNASFAYGLGDVVDVGISTGLTLSPDVAFSRAVTLQGHYLAYDGKAFDFAPGLILPILFFDNAPFSLVLDLPARYVASKTVFLYFGQGAIPIGLSPDFSLALQANGGVGVQVAKPTVLFADTSVLTLLLVPDAAATGFWETLVLNLGGQYSPTKEWDIGGKLTLTNTWELPDSLGIGINLYGRFRF